MIVPRDRLGQWNLWRQLNRVFGSNSSSPEPTPCPTCPPGPTVGPCPTCAPCPTCPPVPVCDIAAFELTNIPEDDLAVFVMTRFDLRPVSYPEIEGLDPSALWMEVAERDISFYFSCSSKESVAWCLSFGYYQEGGGIYIGNEGKFYTYEFEGKKVNMSVDVRRYRDGSLEVKWWVGDKGGLKAFYNHRCRLLMLHLPIFGHQRWMEVSRLSWHAKYRQGNGNLMWERYWGGVHFDDCPA